LYIILYIQIAHEVKAQGHKKMRMLVFSYQFQLQKNNLEHQFLLTPGQQHIIYDKTKWARVTILVYNEGLSDMLLHISAGQQVAAERIIASICNSLIEGFSDIFLARVTILTNYNCEQTVPDRNRVPGPQEKNLDLTLRLLRKALGGHFIEGFSDIFLARVTILTNYNCEQTVPDRNRVPGPQEKNLDLTLRLLRKALGGHFIEGFSDIFLARVTILTNYNCEQTVPDRNRVPGPQEKNLDLTLRFHHITLVAMFSSSSYTFTRILLVMFLFAGIFLGTNKNDLNSVILYAAIKIDHSHRIFFLFYGRIRAIWFTGNPIYFLRGT
ncbi:hypothetical protein ACJX0J_010155, partial [Zea mays]